MNAESFIEDLRINNTVNYDKMNELNIKDMEWLDKCDVIDAMYDFVDIGYVKDFLIDLVNDKNYIVRCSVYEALGNVKKEQMLDELMGFIKKERSATARSYLIDAIGRHISNSDFNENWYSKLNIYYERENSIRVLIQYWAVFYIIKKDEQYIYRILEQISNKDYHIRCTVINSMPALSNKNITEVVKRCYAERAEIETSVAVQENIKQALADINNGVYGNR